MTRISRRAIPGLRRFRRSEDGAMTVEAAILMPFLFVLVLICYVVFDAIRQHAVNQRAAYAVVDMISRETDHITPAYMSRARDALMFLARLEQSEISVRVTVAEWNQQRRRFERRWSQRRGNGLPPYTQRDVQALEDRLPLMVDGDQIVIFESLVSYDPPFNLGFLPREIETFSFARPRYAPQVLFCANDAGCTGSSSARSSGS